MKTGEIRIYRNTVHRVTDRKEAIWPDEALSACETIMLEATDSVIPLREHHICAVCFPSGEVPGL